MIEYLLCVPVTSQTDSSFTLRKIRAYSFPFLIQYVVSLCVLEDRVFRFDTHVDRSQCSLDRRVDIKTSTGIRVEMVQVSYSRSMKKSSRRQTGAIETPDSAQVCHTTTPHCSQNGTFFRRRTTRRAVANFRSHQLQA